MKNFTTILFVIFLTGVVLSFNNTASKEIGKTTSGKIMAFRTLTLLENINPAELEKFGREQLAPTFKNEVLGVESYIIKGQRGDNKGQYVHLLIFENEAARNFYFPYEHSGEDNISEEALKVWQKGQIMLLDSLPKYTEPLQSTVGYTDYIFFE